MKDGRKLIKTKHIFKEEEIRSIIVIDENHIGLLNNQNTIIVQDLQTNLIIKKLKFPSSETKKSILMLPVIGNNNSNFAILRDTECIYLINFITYKINPVCKLGY